MSRASPARTALCRAVNQSRRKCATGIGSLMRRLARRSLKPQLNQIRTWVRQGRTDAWIAHQLEVSVGDIRSFKREHELVAEDEGDEDSEEEDEDKPKRRRRGRRGGRGRRRKAQALEGTFDHGDEGYGLWLDPAIQDDPVYAEHWAGHRPVNVTVEAERIVIKRAGDNGDAAA